MDLLSAYQGAKSVEALKEMKWKTIWLIPAIFAGVIMVLFVLVFHDDTRAESGKDNAHAS